VPAPHEDGVTEGPAEAPEPQAPERQAPAAQRATSDRQPRTDRPPRTDRQAPPERQAPSEQLSSDRGPAERPRNPPQVNGNQQPADRGATGPQLRRFIKSRAYVPMHELRRRFVINGADDDVTPVDVGEHRRVFVGLPEREGKLLGELLRGGDIGYELSLDPISPIVVGVYPMRPVTRV